MVSIKRNDIGAGLSEEGAAADGELRPMASCNYARSGPASNESVPRGWNHLESADGGGMSPGASVGVVGEVVLARGTEGRKVHAGVARQDHALWSRDLDAVGGERLE